MKKVVIIVGIIILSILGFLYFDNTNNVNAVQNEYEEYFVGANPNIERGELNEITKMDEYKNKHPKFTILTHGQNGDASHWSNSMGAKSNNEDKEELEMNYDSESLVEKLRNDAEDADVYVAKMANKVDADKKQFYLYEYVYNEGVDGYEAEALEKIDSFKNHTIIVFESTPKDKETGFYETNSVFLFLLNP